MFTIIKQSSNERSLTFHAQDVDVSIINAIRRVILAEIPNVAIAFDPYKADSNDVHIYENTTCLHNEFMGHRISLIPVQLSQEDIETFTPDKYKFVIQLQNESNEPLYVTTDDIVVYDGDGNVADQDKRDAIFPRDDITKQPILITKLKPNLYHAPSGDKLHIEFFARLGTTKETHARFSPVSTCTYFNVVDPEKAEQAFEKMCEDQEKKQEGKLSKEQHDILKKRFELHDRYRYFYTNEYDEPNKFEFTIDSECRLTPVYLVRKAIDVLITKLQLLIQDTDKMHVHILDNESLSASITLFNEDHTLGNLLQAMLYNTHIRATNGTLSYVGYYLPHPLTPEIVIKLIFKTSQMSSIDASSVETFIKNVISNETIPFLGTIKKEWENACENVVAVPPIKKIRKLKQPKEK